MNNHFQCQLSKYTNEKTDGHIESKTKPNWEFLAVQWLRFHASPAGGSGLILGQRTKISHAINK